MANFDVFVVSRVLDRKPLLRQGDPRSVSVSRMAQWYSCCREGVSEKHSIEVSVVRI
jgi:hypothetical protein